MPIGTSHSSDLSLELSEKCGWLLKWTNYIKGYRQRWFVLDSCANLSYYRDFFSSGSGYEMRAFRRKGNLI
ncbi:unnamed protein product [Wuchereria bancrofti]|uniref:PH domain-containing protein n=1 Tax=Wuchereria bancrofti TaxID=6293 RepID=A0A3P7FPG0_WUCBA|nr:unnamed protein product [Wuchereria bancrofti]